MDNQTKNLVKIVLFLTGIFMFTAIINNLSGGGNSQGVQNIRIVPSYPSNNGTVGSRTAGKPF